MHILEVPGWEWVDEDPLLSTPTPQGTVPQSLSKSPEGLSLCCPQRYPAHSCTSVPPFYLPCLSSWNHLQNKPPVPKSLPWRLFGGKPKLQQEMSVRVVVTKLHLGGLTHSPVKPIY